jgi:riboflavin kinase
MISSVIFYLLKKGAHREPVRITTSEIAAQTNVSQQTASRKLIQLEKEGLIVRKNGQVLVTEKAISEARKLLKEVLESLEGTSLVFRGKVVCGLGEGSFFMRKKKYIEAFEKKLCFKPFPGTLNLTISESEIEKRLQLREQKPIVIEGFKEGKRTFGKIAAYRCTINGIPAAVIFPEISLHGLQVLEIIAPFNLRKKLGLSDGSEVIVEVTANVAC